MPSRIPRANRSAFGWWIASYLERFEWKGENRRDLRRRCLAWENTILIKASNRHQAWQKAVALGRLGHGNEMHDGQGNTGTWRFEGITELLPIYERLEHGAEVLWREHRNKSVATIKGMVRTKREINTFDDRPERIPGKSQK